MAIWSYLHPSISTALMRPRRPKQYCLQLVIYIYIYIYRLTYVVVRVVVAVGVMTVLKAIQRESYCRRFLISRNFGDSSEVVSVVSKDIDFGGLNQVY